MWGEISGLQETNPHAPNVSYNDAQIPYQLRYLSLFLGCLPSMYVNYKGLFTRKITMLVLLNFVSRVHFDSVRKYSMQVLSTTCTVLNFDSNVTMWTDLRNLYSDFVAFTFTFLWCEYALKRRCRILEMEKPCLITQNLLLRNVSYYWHEDPTKGKNFKATSSSGM